MAKQKEPWEMTKEEVANWKFPTTGSGSTTPMMAFKWRKEKIESPGEFETLYDLSQQSDQYRFEESLGKGYPDWKTSLSLKSIIEQDKPIKIYRASEEGEIIPGAYVSESLGYTKGHQKSIMGGKGKIYIKEVKPSELMSYSDPHEFIYIPESVEAYHKPIIEKALSECKPVPPEVLKDYPGLSNPGCPTCTCQLSDADIDKLAKALTIKIKEEGL